MDDQDQDTKGADVIWPKSRLSPPRRESPLKNRGVHSASLAFRSQGTERARLSQPISDVKKSYESLTDYVILQKVTRGERIANAVTLTIGAAFSVGLITAIGYEFYRFW